jgi:superfamily II DNA/RNA helicase
MSFNTIEGLELTETVTKGLARQNIQTPTPVQLAAIPPILAGQPVVIHSGTGTGKTLAYLLPLLQRLRQHPQERAVVLAPSVELAMQTLHTAEAYKEPALTSMALVSSGNLERQRKKLKKHPRLIVGTPGRFFDLCPPQRPPKGVRLVVLDEPDPILSERHEAGLRVLLSRTAPPVQLVVAGATLGPNTEGLVKGLMGDDAVRTEFSQSPLHTQISHSLVVLRQGQAKDLCLVRLLNQHRPPQVVVFLSQEHRLRHLFRFLIDQGLRVVTLSLERSKADRQKAVTTFKAGEARLLLTTDSIGRGLDVPGLPWVVHYDLPPSAQAYVHRAGRTGRAGCQGQSIALVTADERALMYRYARDLGLELTPLAP